MAIGLSAYHALSESEPAMAVGGISGLLIGVIVAMGISGFVAGYLGRFFHCYCHGGVIYGFITWSLALILSALLIMPIIHYISFYETSLASATISIADINASLTPQQTLSMQHMLTTNSKHLVWSGWILFILFFLGALSSCIGACYGMRCKKREENNISALS